MDAWDWLIHGANFLAPALVLGVLLAAAGALRRRARAHLAWPVQALLNVVAGSLVLAVGLWLQGRDGTMLTYGALVVTTALCQWMGSGGRRR